MGGIIQRVATSREADTLSARDRIVETAYELFARHGVQAVGVDEIIQRAGVAKATFYHHFASKNDLVLEFLNLREQRWTLAWIDGEARRRAATPEEQLLTIFDLFDEWFHREDFEADSFVNVLLEWAPPTLPARASIEHLGKVRAIIDETSRGSRSAGYRIVHPVLAHPDERIDRLRRCGRPRGCQARPSDGQATDRTTPIDLPRRRAGLGNTGPTPGPDGALRRLRLGPAWCGSLARIAAASCAGLLAG